MARSSKTKFVVLVLTVSWVKAQEYIENLHDSKFITHVREIPKTFEVKGDDASTQFAKYFNRIQEIAKREKINVVYKIKLEINKNPKLHSKKALLKSGRSKKYNIPLKKTSMKLSNFEVWVRKLAEQSGLNKQGHAQNFEMYAPVTTEGQKVITTTKQIKLKYKPIISRNKKTNYTKYVKPVRNRIITLKN